MAISAFIGSAPRAYVYTALGGVAGLGPPLDTVANSASIASTQERRCSAPRRPDRVTRLFPWRRYHGLLVSRLPGVSATADEGCTTALSTNVSPNRKSNTVYHSRKCCLWRSQILLSSAGCVPGRRRQFAGGGIETLASQSSIQPVDW